MHFTDCSLKIGSELEMCGRNFITLNGNISLDDFTLKWAVELKV